MHISLCPYCQRQVVIKKQRFKKYEIEDYDEQHPKNRTMFFIKCEQEDHSISFFGENENEVFEKFKKFYTTHVKGELTK